MEPLRENTDIVLCLTTSGIPGLNFPLEKRMIPLQFKPELEIFDYGMITTCLRMRDQGQLDDPLQFQFVLGAPWGAPATPRPLGHMVDSIPGDATWSIIGIGRSHLPMSMYALVMGGHIRVGMEDNIYYTRGELVKKNSQFVERVARIAEEYGRDIATPSETREILCLPESK